MRLVRLPDDEPSGAMWEIIQSSGGQRYFFDRIGRLQRITDLTTGQSHTLVYDNQQGALAKIEHSQGAYLEFFYQQRYHNYLYEAPIWAKAWPYPAQVKDHTGLAVDIEWGELFAGAYLDHHLISKISHPYLDTAQSGREYEYSDPNFPAALTHIYTFETADPASRSRYAEFHYDDQGRAIYSSLEDGADAISVDYIDDMTRRVTNALGKQATYNYADYNGVTRLQGVTGEPTATCLQSTATFDYDAAGNTIRREENGVVTTFEHNGRGLETSRTEASSTPEARTTTTEWHPTFDKPIAINEPARRIEFTYDAQGRLLSQRVKSLGQAPVSPVPPYARAGEDQSVVDADGDGSVEVPLSAANSTVAEGSIVSYRWTLGETELASGVNPTVSLPLGTHPIVLTVQSDAGLEAKDTVLIEVTSPSSTYPLNPAPGVLTESGLRIDFSAVTLGTMRNNVDGNPSVEENGAALRLVGNQWPYVPINYTLTPNTVLEFDLRIAGMAEIQGIGFDTDDHVSSLNNRGFNVSSGPTRQNFGRSDFAYTGQGADQRMVIPVGQFFTGRFTRLVLMSDDDNLYGADATYSQVRIYEQGSASRYYAVPEGATWASVALALYGSDSVAPALEAALSATYTLTAGEQILADDLPAQLGGAATPTPNTPPSLSITSPQDGDTAAVGDTVPLTATASDNEDGDLSSSIIWSSDRDGALGTINSISTLSVGTHVLTAFVQDSEGESSSASISLTVTASTQNYPLNPAPGVLTESGLRIDFSAVTLGTMRNNVDGDPLVENNGAALRLVGNQWPYVPIDYTLTPNTVLEFDLRIAGMAEIQGIGFDTDDHVSSLNSRGFNFSSGPTRQNFGRSDFAYTGQGEDQHFVIPVGQFFTGRFTRLVFMSDDDNVYGADATYSQVRLYEQGGAAGYYLVPDGATWASVALALYGSESVASALEAALSPIYSLTAGEQILADDLPGELGGSATPAPNTPPSLSITSPQDGNSVAFGDAVALTATASDNEDGDLTSAITWSSDRDGALGAITSISTLSVGTHDLTASVQDSEGEASSASVSLTVTSATQDYPLNPAPGVLTESGLSIDFSAVTLGTMNNNVDGNPLVENNGAALRLVGNQWPYVPIDYTLTPNTVLEFDLRIAGMAEIQGIGFDNDAFVSSLNGHGFNFSTEPTRQAFGRSDYAYTGQGADQRIVIPVGQFFTGRFTRLVLISDDDNRYGADATYSQVRLYEQGGQASYYAVPAGATWASVALALYGSDSVAAALEAALSATYSLSPGEQIPTSALPARLQGDV